MRKHQQGMTLVELLVAGVIGLIAASGMVIMMAGTLGTGSQTIKMARLSQDMRTAMQIMTRELRRANYHPSYMACYGNTNCRNSLGIAGQVGTINITGGDCFWFWYDRPQTGTQVPVTTETVAAFRRVEVSGLGKIQMTTTRTTAPACTSNTDWVDLTDPLRVDVMTFSVDRLSSLTEIINDDNDTQTVEKIALTMTARLINDTGLPGWLQANNQTQRQLQAFVNVRNNTTAPAGP